MPDIRVEQVGAVLVLTVDRPHSRNALAPATMAELAREMRDTLDRIAALPIPECHARPGGSPGY